MTLSLNKNVQVEEAIEVEENVQNLYSWVEQTNWLTKNNSLWAKLIG